MIAAQKTADSLGQTLGKIGVCVVFARSSAFCAGVGLAYRAGRWCSPSFIGAEFSCFLITVFGVTILGFFLKVRGKFKQLALYGAVFGVMVASHPVIHKLMLNEYATGFENVIFASATPDEWRSLGELVKKSFSSGNGVDRTLPAFTRKVYPNYDVPPHAVVAGGDAPNSHESHVYIFWRMPAYNLALDIGKAEHVARELYRKECAKGLSIVILGGG